MQRMNKEKASPLGVTRNARHVRDPLELRQVVLPYFPRFPRHELHVSLGRASEKQPGPRDRAGLEHRLTGWIGRGSVDQTSAGARRRSDNTTFRPAVYCIS